MDDLGRLAEEIRQEIIAIASVNGGHLAPHLGVVELTLALHHAFETERDHLVWDVGHQCYAHKFVTGRRAEMETIRRKDGLSGYPKRSESPYDSFGVGHSSTSISAALGMAIARDRLGENRNVAAIIGDGAITAGMAWEALAHAGHMGTDMLVILNDNEMSISPNVGALSAYFNRLITDGMYSRAREDMNSVLKRVLPDPVTKAASRFEHSVKGFLTPGTIFEEFGFKYVGPVDGHDLPTLVECLNNFKKLKGPIFFHVVTKKGKGYSYAEDDPQGYHGVNPFNIETGEFQGAKAPTSKPVEAVPSFTQAFTQAFIDAAHKNPRIVGITAAMPTGTGMDKAHEVFPDRVYDVGICEQHAVTLAAGLAVQGMKPVCAIYSTFLQRGYDQCLHDVCLQELPVVFAIDRAGAVGEDSPTQQGAFDLSFLRSIPNISVMAPRDADDTVAMMDWAMAHDGPSAVRYARSKAPRIGDDSERDITKGEVLREGDDGVFLAIGPVLRNCLRAADILGEEGLSIAVADGRWVKPLDGDLLTQIRHLPMLTVEENTIVGGFGSAVMEHYAEAGCLSEVRIQRQGFPDAFIPHSTRDEQLAAIGLDAESLARSMRSFLETHAPGQPVT
jgi:1-deoxy-D-xylulose-5-phosphate synthase